MNLMWDQLAQEGLVHAGFLLVALAFLLRDILYLRLVAMGAYSFFICYQLAAGIPASWPVFGWYVLFAAINAVQSAILWHERRLKHLTSEERQLYDIAFPALDVGAVRRIMRRGKWRSLQEGESLTVQGERCAFVYAVLDGCIDIEVDGRPVAQGGPGQFIGEIGFLAKVAATATTVVSSRQARVLAWSRQDLEKMLRRSPELRSTTHAAIGRDLARKIAEHTVRTIRPQMAAHPAAHPAT